jgi:cytoskeleton protein RodZ
MQAETTGEAGSKTRDQNDALDMRANLSSVPVPDELILTNPVPANIEPANIGEYLRTAREQAGLSVTELAHRLRMGVKQVDAIERADFASLPQGTFLRGFVRNYAKAVGLDPAEALATLERTHQQGGVVLATKIVTPKAAESHVQMKTTAAIVASPRMKIMVYALVALALLLTVWYWWEFIRPYRAEGGRAKPAEVQAAQVPHVAQAAASATTSTTPVDPAALATDAAAPIPPTTATSATTVNDPNTAVSNTPPPLAAAPVATTATPTANETPPAEPRKRRPTDNAVLGFTFTGASWVEVVDSTGRTVLSRRFTAGETDEISGRAPFSIVVGNATVTRMAYNGREFDLAPHQRANSTVARLTLK